MSSCKKKSRTNETFFKVDPETGKRVLLPLKWGTPAVSQSAKEKLSERKTRTMTLHPLKLRADAFEESPGTATKMRKVDNTSVRKELFNIASIKTTRPSTGRQTFSRRSNHMKKVQRKNPCELSPLLDMEEVEEELLHKKRFLRGYPFKTPKKPCINFTKSVKCSMSTKKVKFEGITAETEKTSKPVSSNDIEFLALEEMCYTGDPNKENNSNQSPISTVCSLLKGTVLENIEDQKTIISDISDTHPNIQTIIKDIQNLTENNKKITEEYKISHMEISTTFSELLDTERKNYDNFMALATENNNKILDILDKLKHICPDVSTEMENDKENSPIHNRRSVRLSNKSPIRTSKTKLIVSPVIMKSGDLRKTTLNRNLVTKSHLYQIQSPRIQKALDLYNSMRTDISILMTPKLDRQHLYESPKTSNSSRSLSKRIQNQCLLLQDTPVRNK